MCKVPADVLEHFPRLMRYARIVLRADKKTDKRVARKLPRSLYRLLRFKRDESCGEGSYRTMFLSLADNRHFVLY